MTQQIKKTWTAFINSRRTLLGRLSNIHVGDQSGGKGRKPVPMLSGASKCVWQMDREA